MNIYQALCILALCFTGPAVLAVYDESLSSSAMFYSAAAYCDPLAVLGWTCGVACDKNPGVPFVRPVVYISSKDFTYGYVTYNTLTNTIVVAFRGTNGLPTSPDFRSVESFLNWKTNLNFEQVDYEDVADAKAHKGFMDSYNVVRNSVRSSVQALLDSFPKASVLVTGHSLGGALATMCATDLKRRFSEKLQPGQLYVYTFGAPRVGNENFARYFETLFGGADVFRVVHTDDAVPHVPSLVQKFVHIGQEVWFTGDGAQGYTECSTATYEDPSCSDSLVTYGIDAHMLYLGQNITSLCPVSCLPGECEGCPVVTSYEGPYVLLHDHMQEATLTIEDHGTDHFSDVSQMVEENDIPVKVLHSQPLASTDPRCPNCDSFGCHDDGVCNNYCSDSKKWWGPTCTNECMGNCDSFGCNKGSGKCNNYCSDATKWWGPQCDKPCLGNCDSFGCNKGSGKCNNYCSDAKKWWGDQCDKECAGHCDSFGCNKGSGKCNNYCIDAKKWWGPQCDLECTGHCDSFGCNKGSGKCNNYCNDSKLWWGDQCDRHCGGHCDSFGCNKKTGFCNNRCADSKLWWDSKCCSNPCMGNCDSFGCNINSGECNNYCSDSKLWWGPHCDKTCMGNCDSFGCNKGSGLCNNYCSNAKQWWGPQCDQPCLGNCDSFGCNKGSGKCNNYCSNAQKWWGDQCDKECTGHCDSFGCNKGSGKCNNYCSHDGMWWGPNCENSCEECSHGCHQDTGTCY